MRFLTDCIIQEREFMVFCKLGRNHHKTPRMAILNLRTFILRAQQMFNFCALLDEKVKIQNNNNNNNNYGANCSFAFFLGYAHFDK